jgi:alpha/beta hydrolase fold
MSAAKEKPAVDAILLKVLEAVPFQLTTDGGVEASRQRFRDLPRRDVHPEVRNEDRTIDGPAGPIPIRMYWPPTNGEAIPPVVVFLHGGGWSVGDLDTYDGTARGHAVGAAAVVVSVDYRLAPEHPPPPLKMPGPQRNGWPNMPASWVPIRTGWLLPATPPAAISRRWCRCWRAMRVGRRSCSSCCGIRRQRGMPRCRRSPRTRRRRFSAAAR